MVNCLFTLLRFQTDYICINCRPGGGQKKKTDEQGGTERQI